MDKKTYKLKDFAEPIAVAVTDPQKSCHNIFVGLEHYDSGEPVISRFSDTSLLNSSCKEFQKNDILIARRNVYLRRAGIAPFDGLTSGDSIVLRLFEDCEERTGISYDVAIKIIPFVLNSNSFWLYANRHADGMNSKRISKEKVLDYEFDLPSLAEQKVLAEKLWAAYEVKQSYLKMIAATEEMVKAQFIEMFGDPIQNSKGWVKEKMGSVCKYISDGSHYSPPDDNTSIIPMLSVKDMSNNGFLYNECKHISIDEYKNLCANGCKPLRDDVLVAKDGSYFKYIFPLVEERDQAILSSIAILRPNKEVITPRFLCEYLKNNEVLGVIERNYLTGTAIRRVILKGFKEIQVYLPPVGLQKNFESIYNQADKSISELRKSVDAIDKVIKSLINENL